MDQGPHPFHPHRPQALEKRDTEIVYLRGNHDDILLEFLPLSFENLLIVEEYMHVGARGRYLVLHGDVFDSITKNFVFLAHLGDWGYLALLVINRAYNVWRAWRGLEYWSLSQAIKARVKAAVSHVSNFEEHIAGLARRPRLRGVMCGHIHTPADKKIGDIHYLNSGRLGRDPDRDRGALGRPIRADRVCGFPEGIPRVEDDGSPSRGRRPARPCRRHPSPTYRTSSRRVPVI